MARASRRGGRGAEPVRVESGVGVLQLEPDPGRRGGRTLLIDGQVHGHVDLDDPTRLELDYLARMAAGLEVVLPRGEPADVLHLGGGAFGLPRFVAATRPQARQTVVERSGAVIQLAERHLRLRRSDVLRVVKGDAAAHLGRVPDGALDLVVGDAFVGVTTPEHLRAPALADEVARVLRPGGHYLVNVVDQPPWDALGAELRALRSAFGGAPVAWAARDVASGRRAGNVLVLAGRRGDPARPGATGTAARIAPAVAGGAHPSSLLPPERVAGLGGGA